MTIWQFMILGEENYVSERWRWAEYVCHIHPTGWQSPNLQCAIFQAIYIIIRLNIITMMMISVMINTVIIIIRISHSNHSDNDISTHMHTSDFNLEVTLACWLHHKWNNGSFSLVFFAQTSIVFYSWSSGMCHCCGFFYEPFEEVSTAEFKCQDISPSLYPEQRHSCLATMKF